MLRVENRSWFKALLLIAALGLFASGCSKAPKNHWWQFWRKGKPASASIYPGETGLPSAPSDLDSTRSGNVDVVSLDPNADPSLGVPTADPMRMEASQYISELQNVYFDFDSSALSPDAMATLDGNFQWLQSHAGLHVLIEGHCDDRGTVEYNLNLGQRRADAVREYLTLKGLDPSTLHTISYGEERPLVEGTDESAWAQNRRAQFLVY
ncbi:MAG TPA: peptidoglycan-associated lipoprotein Pal [Candidatus Sumerlaeota bacterium]|nr:peptidoglycan-associated lipoprotein Pal [Candidatus Sumerlaeota bacterium]